MVKREEPPRSFVEVIRGLSSKTLRIASRRLSSQSTATELAAVGDAAVLQLSKAASAPHSLSLGPRNAGGTGAAAGSGRASPRLAAVKGPTGVEAGQGAAATEAETDEQKQLDRAESGQVAVPSEGSCGRPTKPLDAGEDADEDEGDEQAAAGVADAGAAQRPPRSLPYRVGRGLWLYIYE
jgi:hypothetical protein